MTPLPFVRRMLLAIAGSVVVLGAVSLPAHAQLVHIEWGASGAFERSLTIAPAKFVEVCGKLAKGQSIAWWFKGEQPLNFNIHYHEGKNVVFPAKQDKVSSLDGTLAVPVDQDYCWMWENKGSATAPLSLTLRRS
jgi:hypothetical protein